MGKTNVTILKTTGIRQEKEFSHKLSLSEAQEFVGGYVEEIRLSNGDQMLVNEDGLRLKLPHNEAASLLAGRPIVGSAVILSGTARWC